MKDLKILPQSILDCYAPERLKEIVASGALPPELQWEYDWSLKRYGYGSEYPLTRCDELEAEFARVNGNGLFIDPKPKFDVAIRWAALMNDRRKTDAYSLRIANEDFLTGRYFGYFVILFPHRDADGSLHGLTAYRLTGEGFGDEDLWSRFGAPECIELDAKGNLIVDAEPLPFDGSDNPAPEQLALWRKKWRALRKFKAAHHGRTPQQEAEYQIRRISWKTKFRERKL